MSRKGLELIKPLDDLSEELSLILEQGLFPSKFSTFISLYKTGHDSFHFERLLLKNESDFLILTYGKMYENEPIEGHNYSGTIDHIFSPDRLLIEIDKYKQGKEKWNELGFVQIGLMFHGDVLLLGIEDENEDEIWRYGQGLLEKLSCKLENNIFDFFKKLNEKVDIEGLKEMNITLESIYRKLGENFWRIRE
jgi:hypothetical protein